MEELTRITSIEPARFKKEFVERGRPVLLPGLVSRWKATSRWSPQYLGSLCGQRQVDVEAYPSGDYHNIEGFTHRSMTLSEYLERISGPSTRAERNYLVMKLPGALPELHDEIEMPSYVDAPRLDHPTLFLGRDTVSNCHFHARHHAILCVVTGSKTLELFPPEETSQLDPEPWYSPAFAFSRVHPDLPERFPGFKPARKLTVELQAGDGLFIPIHWWHWVRSLGFTSAVTYFWRAPLRDWSFPIPGRSCVAALPVELQRRVGNRLMSAFRDLAKHVPASRGSISSSSKVDR